LLCVYVEKIKDDHHIERLLTKFNPFG